MQISTVIEKGSFLIRPIYKNEQKNILEKEYWIQDNPLSNTSVIYLGDKKQLDNKKIFQALETILSSKERSYQIDTNAFVINNLDEDQIIKFLIYQNEKINGKRFSLKSTKETELVQHLIYSKLSKAKFSKEFLIAEAINKTKQMQDMPANILTIEKFVKMAQELIKHNSMLSLKVIDHKEMQKNKMNLILSVNLGSKQKAKVLVIEYQGNSKSKDKTTLVGKGIIFDSGGYNLKTGKHMIDMKFDMSGAAIALHTIDVISKLKLKKNFSVVIPLTDNMMDASAQTPESIWESMSGKTVEVANTDAEGRLILADGITYAVKKLNSTRVIDIATLTGTVVYALGRYTGAWTSCDKDWEILSKVAKNENELIWRMPLDEMYIDNLSKNTFADTFSCSNTEYPDSNIAAAWLQQFAEKRKFIHLDIAGSADQNSQGQAPMIRTLVHFMDEN